jgi:predicted DCC family thiol-disulfide oxidoreductase YuxK
MPTPENPRIILYDGACRVCRRAAAYVEGLDSHARFSLIASDSDKGMGLRQSLDFQNQPIDSIIVIEEGRFFAKSTAVMKIMKELPGLRIIYYLLKVVPRPFRDWCYDLFARNRHVADTRPAE